MVYPIEIVKKPVSRKYFKKFLDRPFKDVVKFVVDVKKEIIAFGGELHSDAQELLINNGSNAKDLWGGNLFFSEDEKKYIIEYSSLINIKPSQNNFAMDIEDKKTRMRIEKVLKKIIIDL